MAANGVPDLRRIRFDRYLNNRSLDLCDPVKGGPLVRPAQYFHSPVQLCFVARIFSHGQKLIGNIERSRAVEATRKVGDHF